MDKDQERRRLAYDDVCHLLLVYKTQAGDWKEAYERLVDYTVTLVSLQGALMQKMDQKAHTDQDDPDR